MPKEPTSALRERLLESLRLGNSSRETFNKATEQTPNNLEAFNQQSSVSIELPTSSTMMNSWDDKIQDSSHESDEDDEEYHFGTIAKSGTSGRTTVLSTASRSQPHSITSMTSASEPISQDTANYLPQKRARESSPVSESSFKRRKSTRHLPGYNPNPMSDATTEGGISDQQAAQTSQRPIRQKFKKVHFDEMPQIAASSSKSRTGKDLQTPKPGSDSDSRDNLSSHAEVSEPATMESDLATHGGRNRCSSKVVIGMDGIADEPFDFDFGSDGSGSKPKCVPHSSASDHKESTPNTGFAPETQSSVSSTFDSASTPKPKGKTVPLAMQKQRAPRSKVSKAELKGLLGSHNLTGETYNTPRSSFLDSATDRSVRSANRKVEKEAGLNKVELEEIPLKRLVALCTINQSRNLLVVKGLVEKDWKTIGVLPSTDIMSPPNNILTARGISKPGSLPKSKDTPTAPSGGRRRTRDKEAEEAQRHREKLHRASMIAAASRPPVAVMQYTIQTEPKHETSASSSKVTKDISIPLQHHQKGASKVSQATLTRSASNNDQELDVSKKQGKITSQASSMTVGLAGTQRKSSNEANAGDAPGNGTSARRIARPKSRLTIETGKVDHANASEMSSPLTTRTYTHTREGRKAPTPKSGTFPKINKPTTSTNYRELTTNYESPSPGRSTMRTKSSSDVDKLALPPLFSSTNVTARQIPTMETNNTDSKKKSQKGRQRKLASASSAKDTLPSPPPWTPIDLCKDSVLSYACKEQVGEWFNLEIEKDNSLPTRNIPKERGGVFRAHSIMVGFRYVFGADVDKSQENDGKGKGNENEIPDVPEAANNQSQSVGNMPEQDVEMMG